MLLHRLLGRTVGCLHRWSQKMARQAGFVHALGSVGVPCCLSTPYKALSTASTSSWSRLMRRSLSHSGTLHIKMLVSEQKVARILLLLHTFSLSRWPRCSAYVMYVYWKTLESYRRRTDGIHVLVSLREQPGGAVSSPRSCEEVVITQLADPCSGHQLFQVLRQVFELHSNNGTAQLHQGVAVVIGPAQHDS